jgi:hypothetical protein
MGKNVKPDPFHTVKMQEMKRILDEEGKEKSNNGKKKKYEFHPPVKRDPEPEKRAPLNNTNTKPKSNYAVPNRFLSRPSGHRRVPERASLPDEKDLSDIVSKAQVPDCDNCLFKEYYIMTTNMMKESGAVDESPVETPSEEGYEPSVPSPCSVDSGIKIPVVQSQPENAIDDILGKESGAVVEDVLLAPSASAGKTPAVVKALRQKPKKLKNLIMNPGLHYFARHFHTPVVLDNGQIVRLKEQENLAVVATLCYIQDLCFGIVGDSGSGKTVSLKRLLKLDPTGDSDYIITAASDKAIHYDKDRVNSKRRLIVKELQKCKNLIEPIKELSEGDAASLIRVKGKSIEEFVVGPMPVTFTYAYENKYDIGSELMRRIIFIDASAPIEKVGDIQESILDDRCDLNVDDESDPILLESLKYHVEKMWALKDVRFYDPFSPYLKNIIPETKKAIPYMSHYLNLLNASAKFNYDNRMKFKLKGKTFVVLDIEDHVNIFNSYYKSFVKTLKEWDEGINPTALVNWKDFLKFGFEFLESDPKAQRIRAGDRQFAEKWYDRQVKQDGIYINDYKTGEEKRIGDVPIITI